MKKTNHIIPLLFILLLTSCSYDIVPVYKYNVTYKKCWAKKPVTVTYTGSYLDTKPYYDEKNKILHLMWWEAFNKKDLTPVGGIPNVCSAEINHVAEQVNKTLLHPDINATGL